MKQSLGPLLVGIISIMAGLWVGMQMRIERCVAAGGRWDPPGRVCLLPPGTQADVASLVVVPYAVGALVTMSFAFLLLRMWMAIQKKNALRAQREAGAPKPPAP